MNQISKLCTFTKTLLYDTSPKTQYKQSLIQQVALKSLCELAALFAISCPSCCFLPSYTAVVIHCGIGFGIWAFNTTVRVIQAYCYCILQTQKSACRQPLEKLYAVTKWICPMQCSVFYTHSTGTVVHELGHALTAHALLNNAKPRIKISADGLGMTMYKIRQYSYLGTLLGPSRVDLLITAGGMLATACVSSSLILGAHIIKKRHPQLYRYVIASSVASVAREVLYACSALGKAIKPSSHDFVHLRFLGIHPLVSAAIVAAPTVIALHLDSIIGFDRCGS